MPAPKGNVHYLARNHHSWTPAAVIVLDSETRTVGEGEHQAEQLRCWTAQLVRRRHRRRAGEISRAEGFDGRAAAAAIDDWASQDKSTWLYAHNVAFDLVTTNLAVYLSDLGWQLSSRHAVSGAAPWIVLHKGRQDVADRRGLRHGGRSRARVKWQHTLTIADSFSLMPVPLATLAAYSPEVKPPLPEQDDDQATWLARCWADTRILTWSLLTLMDWWERADLGKWSVSGAACGWNSYRHKIGPRDVTIDPEADVVAWEHRAIYGGRRDIFRCGQLPKGRYAEIDFTAAYPTIAATQLLPAKRMGPLTPKIADAILAGRCRYGMVAEVELQTDVPRWPLRALGRVFYPVGRFRTWLAGPEIAEAHQMGCLVSVGAGWFYAMSDHMQPWARWALSLLDADDETAPAPARIFAKGIGRSVCGKWAQRGWSTEHFPGPPGQGWSYEECFIAGTDASASITSLAGQHYLSVADQESEHEFPAVLAYIESHCRLRLARVIETAPPESVIQCDTDGVMASLTALEDGLAARLPWLAGERDRGQLIGLQLQSWQTMAAPLAMREKTVFEQAVIHGPQHVVIDGRPRFSGVPASAWAAGDNRWCARLWPGLSWQIQHGDASGYVRPVQDYLVVGPYAAGWVLADGAVRPVEAFIDDQGVSTIQAWRLTRWAAAGDRLAADQAGWSRALVEVETDGQPMASRAPERSRPLAERAS